MSRTRRSTPCVIPLPDRKPQPPKPHLPLVKRLSAALDELEICLLALGIVSELKIVSTHEEEV